ncbi:hypothetical protein EK904_011410 [Melospiza melodia maxima]|nr:hypothetical protein EK904_011410 [Melospiza melodia maxima]
MSSELLWHDNYIVNSNITKQTGGQTKPTYLKEKHIQENNQRLLSSGTDTEFPRREWADMILKTVSGAAGKFERLCDSKSQDCALISQGKLLPQLVSVRP